MPRCPSPRRPRPALPRARRRRATGITTIAAVLLLAGLTVGPLAAWGGASVPARAAAKACRGGVVVRLGRRQGCVRTSALKHGGATSYEQARARQAAAVSDPALLRRLLGRHAGSIPSALTTPGRRVVTALLRAQQAAHAATRRRSPAPPTGARRIATAAAGMVLDPMTFVAPGDGEAGGGSVTSAGHQNLTSNGLPVRLDAKMSQTMLADQCPDEHGEIHGTFADGLTLTGTVGPMGKTRMRIVTTSSVSTKATITAHVGPDAKIQDYDALVDVEVRVKRQTLGPAGLEHFGTDETVNRVHFALVGIKLTSRFSDMISAQHLQSVSLSRNGSPALATFKGGQLIVHKDFTDQLAKAIDLVAYGDTAPLRDAEAAFSSGKCLTASFAPGQLSFPGGATDADPVTVTVTDRKGRTVDILLHARTSAKGVAPEQAETGASGARFVVSTDPQSGGANLQIDGTSNRGTVSGEISGSKPDAKAYGFRVHLSGTGSYHEEDVRTTDTTQTHEQYDTPDLSYTADWPDIQPVILRVDGGEPSTYGYGARTATMSGTTSSSGTHTEVDPSYDASFTCSGPVADQADSANSIAVVQSSAGTALTIDLFGLLTADSSSAFCSTTGTWYGSVRHNSVGASIPSAIISGPRVTVPVSLDLLSQPSFTLQLHPDALPSCVAVAGSCTDSASFTATITFTRFESCTPTTAGGYGCSRP